ncbi:acyl-CoA desaturase [Candidatus Legionella polyplacis]|uniref:DesA family fatty acid desaturase n=1 Tax=Candidatus Legionella polyplacis TaxID=2005262 RepID=UPI000C1F3753|nr:fatty acid desaturase [Candidatus Legionella polyplacis]ATW01789.1 acyl-CoA desaturase [Candidatus Legionella polyplacis]
MVYGVLNLSFFGNLVAVLVLTQLTIASVTIYLHRCQAHRSIILHPVMSHFFRFWLWLTTGMITAEWVAVHRKHHAKTDICGDPHSPKIEGLNMVLWNGIELYRRSLMDKKMIKKYSHNTPEDWIEKNFYSKFSSKGVLLMFFLDILFFGFPGISIWGIQMLWIPFHAAGVINGIGHYFGYRNFECVDCSKNIFPWGFWIGGEELHNNHHAFSFSAKFSNKWWEFDMGWVYICFLRFFGMVKVRKVFPRLMKDKSKLHIDLDTVKAVIRNRFQIMSCYYNDVIYPILKDEKRNSFENRHKYLLNKAKYLLRLQDNFLSSNSKFLLKSVLKQYKRLQIVYNFRTSLQNIWFVTASSQKDLIDALVHWCKQAEESNVEVLYNFSQNIKKYV